jgi:predicted PurR-regulated permease PerM
MLQDSKIKDSIQSVMKFSVLEILQYTLLISFLLYFGKTLFIPLSLSMLISFTIYPICKWLEDKGTNKTVAIVLPLFGLFLFFGGLLFLLLTQIIEFSNEWGLFKIKIVESINQLSLLMVEKVDFSTEKQVSFIKNILDNSGSQAFSLLQKTIYSLSESFFYLIIVPIYSALILFYRKMLVNVLYRIFTLEKKKIVHEILVETIHAYYNFIKGMLTVYLIVGLLNSIGLAILGIPHPFLFGFIASILTFIPFVGIIISALLPIAISWITYNSIWYPIGVILVFSIVQILEAYIIFPFAVGSRLKINTLAIILVIIIGGIIWGAVGMIIFIPFISIIKLIADRTESLKTVAMLLGEGNNEIDN